MFSAEWDKLDHVLQRNLKAKWYLHVMYYEAQWNNVLHNEIIEGYIHEKRGKGRQHRTWVDDLKDWTGIKIFGALKRTAEDQVKWKFMVSDLHVEDGTKL